ncbi:MAG TPA: HDOD domain-containing protein [Steroidobacteraceae bacterium]|jgi:HD-like signal output (HDOD) protein|nr:HDOD domain-containing protein [Steroidobacteraceae bacterium]
MLIALATVLLVGAAVAVLHRVRAGAAPAAAEPVEILLEPQDLREWLSPPQSAAPAGEARPASPLDSAQALRRLHELALGAPVSGVAGPGHDAVMAATIAATEDGATLRQLAPRRPSLLPQLIRTANDDAAPRRELAAIIRRDPSLVGNLLEMANSSFYRVTERPVESIDRAVVMLGSEGIRSLIAAAAMQPIFRVAGGPFPRFPHTIWQHAWRAANAAVVHAAMVERADPFAAELLSLVWGLGDVVLFRTVLERYKATEPDRALRPHAAVIAALLETQSAPVARRIGAAWDLSAASLAALEQQARAAEPLAPLGRSLRFGRTVGALAVLCINGVLDEAAARASLPPSSLPREQLERMWVRMTGEPPGTEGAAAHRPDPHRR